MWDHIIQGKGGHLPCPGEILCGALDQDPLGTIGYQVISKDHTLKNESLGKTDKLPHWAAHPELCGWHRRLQPHCLPLYKAMWLIPLRCGGEDEGSG